MSAEKKIVPAERSSSARGRSFFEIFAARPSDSTGSGSKSNLPDTGSLDRVSLQLGWRNFNSGVSLGRRLQDIALQASRWRPLEIVGSVYRR
jgi:hypothetical protein